MWGIGCAPDSTVRDTSSLPFDWCEIDGETLLSPLSADLPIFELDSNLKNGSLICYSLLLRKVRMLWRPHKPANEGSGMEDERAL
jgi:hypothetical protein